MTARTPGRQCGGAVPPPAVAHIVESCAYGVGRHVTDLLEALHERGEVQLCLIYSQWRADARFRERVAALSERGIPCVAVPMARGIAPARDTAALFGITRALRALGPIALVHTHSSKAGVLGGAAARMLGIPAVHTPNGLAFKAARGPVSRAIYRTLETIISRWSRYTIAVSDEEARTMVRYQIVPDLRCRVVENAVPDAARPARGTLRRELGFGDKTVLVGAVGRITYQKDPTLFVQVARESIGRARTLDWRFVWIGEGEQRAQIEALIDEYDLGAKVHFIGERSDVDTLVGDIDVLLLTSRYEGLSYALLEAMRAGVPIVASSVEGTRSVLDGAGTIVDSRDAREFATALEHLCADPTRLVEFGRLSRTRYVSRYGIERMIDQVSAIYGECTQLGPSQLYAEAR